MRRNNFPDEQIPQWFLLLSENLSASYYPGAAVFVKHASEIFWQPIRGNLHWRQDFMATRPRRGLQGHLGHLRNSLGSDGAARQGIMEKSGIYVRKQSSIVTFSAVCIINCPRGWGVVPARW